MYSDKQAFNGQQGEDRTRQILGKNFYYAIYSVDVYGRDFEIELRQEKRREQDVYPIKGKVQSKFFENNNEVKIAKIYVEDEVDARTDFFAMLHTDEGENEICFFFTAEEIRKEFRLRDEDYVFSLTKERKFEKYRGLSKNEINKRIEQGLQKTEEIRNEKFIKIIKERYLKDLETVATKESINKNTAVYKNHTSALFNRIKDETIIDKLYLALSEFNDFRRVVTWRLVEKVSFQEDRHTSTHFNQFQLITNHSEILGVFGNLNLNEKIEIIDPTLFKDTHDFQHKIQFIIERLKAHLVFNVNSREDNASFSLRAIPTYSVDEINQNFENLNFKKTYVLLNEQNANQNLWQRMEAAYVWFMLGKNDKANMLYAEIANTALDSNELVLCFFAKYNQRIVAYRQFDLSAPDLKDILNGLDLSEEKKEILSSLSEKRLFCSYAQEIDELYLKIKDLKQRKTINDTANLISRLFARISEYSNFVDGNWLVFNNSEETLLLFEKVVECAIISYSMKTEHSYHLNSFNDALVQMAIHYCDSNKLLGYFQRNQVRNMPYESITSYFVNVVKNFFSQENIDFLYPEICYFEHRTKNPDLRRKTIRAFSNLCILLTHLDVKLGNYNFLSAVNYFIEKLDFNVHDISLLAHPLLSKPALFKEDDIIRLIQIILSREDLLEGYLLTNCLYTLEAKGFKFSSLNKELTNSLFDVAINHSKYELLKVIFKLISDKEKNIFSQKIYNKLSESFRHELFYQSVMSDSILKPNDFIDSYLRFFAPVSKKIQNKFYYGKSPYTGVWEQQRGHLNKLAEVILKLNNNELLQHEVIKGLMNNYPYYNFVLNVDNFKKGDAFDKFWLLENQAEIVLRRIAQNQDVQILLKKEMLKQNNNELTRIYLMYFTC